MRSVIVFVLQVLRGLRAQTLAKELFPNHNNHAENFGDRLFPTLSDKAWDRTLKLKALHPGHLDNTILGKPGSIAKTLDANLRTLLPRHSSSKYSMSQVPRATFPVFRPREFASYRSQLHREATPGHMQSMDSTVSDSQDSMQTLKFKLLRMAAALDRGQAYNPTSGDHYANRMNVARTIVDEIVRRSPALPSNLSAIDGEWELVFSTVKNGIFRSSPFFLAIQTALGDRETSDWAFKIHELQTHQWGLSKVGRVAQYINSAEGRLYSEFDTTLLALNTIPFVGTERLVPTFGGCVLTVSDVELVGDRLQMEVQYTEGREVPDLPGLPGLPPGVPSPFQNRRVPVNEIWQRLPWNNGRKPTCAVQLRYVDEDMRIMADDDGELFVYMRPVDPRGAYSS